MDTSPHSSEVASWWHTCRSRTIAALYAPIVALLLVKALLAWQASSAFEEWIKGLLGVAAVIAGIVVILRRRKERRQSGDMG